MQQIQDSQGYLILMCWERHTPGEVIGDAHTGDREDIADADIPPVVVISEATRDEWEKQVIAVTGRLPYGEIGPYFYKVIAE